MDWNTGLDYWADLLPLKIILIRLTCLQHLYAALKQVLYYTDAGFLAQLEQN